jgi:sugar phosphate isomerase/epimerase
MKASISSWSYRAVFDRGQIDLLGFVDEVKRQGADGLEIFPRHVRADDRAGHLKEVAAKAKELGLEISSAIAGNDFARPTAADRAEQVEDMKEWIVAAAGAGIARLNTFTGYHADGADPRMEVWRVIDAYREVCPLAEEHGVLLCIENHSSVCPDADGILSIIRAVGSENLRTNPDPSNFVAGFTARSGRDREAIYTETAKVAPLAANAHLKVGDFADDGEHRFLDVGRIHEIYHRAGYDGHVVLEVYGDAENCADVCAKGLALLRRHM